MPQSVYLNSPDWEDYALLDSGDGQKLERFGPYTFVRPEPQAVWHKALPDRRWKSAEAIFQPSNEENGGHFEKQAPIESRWPMAYKSLRFWAQISSSRHLGVFPEQACHWDWIQAQVSAAGRPTQVLNLFGYSGLASLAAARAGARVTHVDASKKAVTWARENQDLSGLNDRPVRWIVDDAVKFVQREGRRQARYDGIILDPPKFGRGPQGEVWEFYKLLPALLQACRQILSPEPLFIVLTAYAIQASPLTLYYALQEALSGLGGSQVAGELVTIERSAGRCISNALYSRWKAS